MKTIDLNADIGEADTPAWEASEAAIVSAISSANIACGGHAGDATSMRRTVRNAKAAGVTIGAHPAYPDRANFGRTSLVLGQDIKAATLKEALRSQILELASICNEEGATLAYVKPHGALYNDAVFDARKADLISAVIADLNMGLMFLGGPNSKMGHAAQQHGLRFVAEGFIDRRYTDDGHLLSRKIDGAVIKNQEERLAQARSLATTGEVQTQSGNTLTLRTGSLCVHGDSAGAVETARQARAAIEAAGLTIKAFA
jgi:UPF0271 protein